jgi:hypothetical protein
MYHVYASEVDFDPMLPISMEDICPYGLVLVNWFIDNKG